MEFAEEQEVEYVEPSQREQSQEEAYGVEGAQSTGGVAVVTGLAVEAAASEAINEEGGSPTSEDPFHDAVNDASKFDDVNWLVTDIPPTASEPPTAPNYGESSVSVAVSDV
jgi:hypothetical protein